MKSLTFISKYLGVAPFDWRNNARKALYNSAFSNDETIEQLKENLCSDNLDIVENSFKVLFSLSHKAPKRIAGLKNDIFKAARRCSHFKIAYFAKGILENLISIDDSAKRELTQATKLITPLNFIANRNEENYRYYNCEHEAEYILGDADYKYKLGNICNAFEYDCKKALKKVLQNMRKLGYRKGKRYWKEVPSKWRRGYYGEKSYKTKLHYYSYHSIQMFLMWCIKNLPIRKRAWDEFLREQKDFEPFFVDEQITDRPSFAEFKNVKLDVDTWLKQKIKRGDVYRSVKLSQPWVVLFESTHIRYEDKVFHREISTCFAKGSLKKVKKKREVFPPYFTCSNFNIDEVPTIANEIGGLSVCGHNAEEVEGKLSPTHGSISDTNFDSSFNPLFPTPELVKDLKLKQRRGTLEYYRGRELVVKCINWQNGYIANVGYSGEDKFELADYGSVLIIKTKYLKAFLKAHKVRLLSTGEIEKRKIDKYGKSWDYKKENTRCRRFAFEISDVY